MKKTSSDSNAVTQGAAAQAPLAQASVAQALPLHRREWMVLSGLLGAALLLRLIFLSAPGHETDIGTFENWTSSLAQYGTKGFYLHTNFVDYPPGYMLVLWLIGLLYKLLLANGALTTFAFMALVKLPAIIADIGIAYLTYLIARRTWSSGNAFVAVAIVAFNPAIWFVSAYWGQADSVAAVFLVWALYLALTQRFEFAWAVLAIAVLIKPQPLVVWPLLLFYQIRRQGWTWRLVLIPLIAALVAYLGSVPFSPNYNPASVLQWLYLRYHTGTQVYPYNSVNAFNLYSIVRDMWQSDTARIWFIPQWAWGVAIFGALTMALTMRQWRLTGPTVDAKTAERGVYMAWFLVLLGLFILATRMHERYMFTALALSPLIWNIGRTQKIVVSVLSVTFIVNLIYALQYLKTPSADLNPPLVHTLSFVNVLCLFVLAGAFLIEEMGTTVESKLTGVPAGRVAQARPLLTPLRTPLAREGLVGLSALDYLIALTLTAAGGFLVFYHLGIPNQRIFDEVYFARAADEYLRHLPQFEWTHPPLTKLIMAASAGIFRHLPDPVGARVGAAAFGTLTIPLLYAFAKRLLSSTWASVTAVFLLMVSGYWYVQSRIATPEIFIAFFSLATLYCLYRLIISSQIVKRSTSARTYLAGALLYLLLTMAGTIFAVFMLSHEAPGASKRELPLLIAAFFAGMLVYNIVRYFQTRSQAQRVIYGDGTSVEGSTVVYISGERVPLKNATDVEGERKTVWRQDAVEITDPSSVVTWNAAGTIAATVDSVRRGDRQYWALWLVLAAVSVACLVTSKWEGFFGLAALWFIGTFVAGQRLLPNIAAVFGRTAERVRFVWGNPFGMRWPLFIASTVAMILAVYLVSYIPFFPIGDNHVVPGKNWGDLWDLQKQMYWYHHNTVVSATHPYSSKWWTWPFELRPVSYYFQTYSKQGANPQIVGEVISLPNPAVWLMGLLTVPLAAWYAWRRRHKGIMLLAAAYIFQWVPWVLSPRIDFEYNFYPNLAIICLCTAYVLRGWWSPAPGEAVEPSARSAILTNRALIGAYLIACLALFVYFFPILSADHITYSQWMNRMWLRQGAPNWYGWI